MNNAALERGSITEERVQARPAAAALEQAPAKKGPIAEGDDGGGREQVEVATPKALKKRWSM
nr:hypothetical protein [Klebsiella pneumoniae subsp. pneumoniae]